MHLGFTGTRHGLSLKQKEKLVAVLAAHQAEGDTLFLHHGDCKGADEWAAKIAGHMGIQRVAHPSDNARWRAYADSEDVRSPKPYAARDADIVRETSQLVACPRGREVPRGSGTWLTVRIARKMRKTVTVLWPDGSITVEFPG